MIISRAEVNSVLSARRAEAARRAAAVESVSHDSEPLFEISGDALAFQELVAEVSHDPFYRTKLVEDLRRRVAEGKYRVPAEQIVERLLGRLLVEATVN